MGEYEDKLVVAIDQGTTGTTVVVMDLRGRTLARATHEFPQYFPAPGWVEHEPEEIWRSVLAAWQEAMSSVPGGRERVIALGIANQRETLVVWDRSSGTPVHRALVWQDRRTAERCAELKALEGRVTAVTGLVVDPYFSASKLEWLLQQDGTLANLGARGKIQFGTIDSFLVHRLSGGKAPPVIEVTNASRTLLMDLNTLKWSEEMCSLWNIPMAILPRIVPSSGIVARTQGLGIIPDGIPISGIAGDQHAALFGQGCIRPGDAKCTYGTGAFVLVNTGHQPLMSRAGLLTTLGWQVGDEVVYALEGSSFIAGAAVQWLRDGLGLIKNASEVEALARRVKSTEGVTFVPALTGLGAPHWDSEARGLICGMTRGTTSAHLARATLEAIAFQVEDLLSAVEVDLKGATGRPLTHLRVDGGACSNDLLMQMQADFSSLRVDRPREIETTARGAGMLAALGIGVFKDIEEVAESFELDKSFEPILNEDERVAAKARWEEAVLRSRSNPCGPQAPRAS